MPATASLVAMMIPSLAMRFPHAVRIDPVPELRGSLEATCPTRTKKADVAEHPQVFDHVGLLVNQPPGTAGLLST